MSNILLVEDDSGIQKMLSISLSAVGYSLIVADNIKSALFEALPKPYLSLFWIWGFLMEMERAFIKEAKIFSDTPIIVVSARDIESEKIEALELGADDYLTKPFGIGELIARLKALQTRRKQE